MHINNGMQVIVDLDIRKFFDTVNHKLLFELLEKEIISADEFQELIQ